MWGETYITTYLKCFFFLPETPSAPSGHLEVKEVSQNAVVLAWEPPSQDGGSKIRGYIIEKRSGRRPDWTVASRIKGNVYEATVTNLVEGHDYFFRVLAENEVGVGYPLESDEKVVPKSPFGKCIFLIIISSFLLINY
jgi:titin